MVVTKNQPHRPGRSVPMFKSFLKVYKNVAIAYQVWNLIKYNIHKPT